MKKLRHCVSLQLVKRRFLIYYANDFSNLIKTILLITTFLIVVKVIKNILIIEKARINKKIAKVVTSMLSVNQQGD